MTTEHLVTILLPVFDPEGRAFPPQLLGRVKQELTDRFGGLTAYARAPAQGLWRDEGKTERDDIVVLEVMTRNLDRDWWAAYRRELEARFRQDAVVVRAHAFEPL